MDRFNALGRGLQIMLIGGVLLLIDTFLHWQSVDTPIGSFGRSAWHGFGGIVLGLLVIVLLAWIALRLAAVELRLPVSETLVAAALAVLILVVAILKNLIDDFSAWPSYAGIVLAAVIALGAWMLVQATGGVEKVRSEIPTRPASSATAAPSAPPPPSEPVTTPPPPPSAQAPSAPPPPATDEPASPPGQETTEPS